MLGLLVEDLDKQRVHLSLGLHDVGVDHLDKLVVEAEVGICRLNLLVEQPPQLAVLVTGLQVGAGCGEIVEVTYTGHQIRPERQVISFPNILCLSLGGGGSFSTIMFYRR